MAAFDELPKKVVMAWRAFVATPEFQEGALHLRLIHAPKESEHSDMAIVRGAHQWKGYQKALSDLEDILTALPTAEKPTEDPPLGG